MASLLDADVMNDIELDLERRSGPAIAQVYCPFMWPHWQTGYDTIRKLESRTVVVTDEVSHEDLFPWPEDFLIRWPSPWRELPEWDGAWLRDVKVFHLHNGWTATTRGLELARLKPDAKYVVTLIGTDINVHARGKRASRRYAHLFDLADAVVCISGFLAERAMERGCPPEKIRVIPLAVDPARLPGWKRPEEFSPEGTLRCVLVARFVPVKNISDAMEAAAAASQEADVTLDVCGNGPMRAELVETAARLNRHVGHQVVTVHTSERGLYPHGAAMNTVRESDCIVTTSKPQKDGAEEGLGVSVIEGQMMGLPALGYLSGGIGEIVVQNETGWMGRFPKDMDEWTDHWIGQEATVEGLANAMVRLATRRDLRQYMGAQARANALSKFSASEVATQLDSLYREIV